MTTTISQQCTPIENAVQTINDILKKSISASHIYCFGMRSQKIHNHSTLFPEHNAQQDLLHFDLLVISERVFQNAAAYLSDIVEKETEGKYTLTLAVYSPKQISSANSQQKLFFKNVLETGWIFLGDEPDLKDLKLEKLPDPDLQGIEEYVQHRLKIGNLFLQDSEGMCAEPLTAAFILHSGIEQLCLGMLHAFLFYHPNHFHLGYLMNLCSNFSELPDQYFPRNSSSDQRLFSILCSNYHDLRFRNTGIFSSAEIELLRFQCLEFQKKVEALIDQRLKTLRNASQNS